MQNDHRFPEHSPSIHNYGQVLRAWWCEFTSRMLGAIGLHFVIRVNLQVLVLQLTDHTARIWLLIPNVDYRVQILQFAWKIVEFVQQILRGDHELGITLVDAVHDAIVTCWREWEWFENCGKWAIRLSKLTKRRKQCHRDCIDSGQCLPLCHIEN